MAGMLEQQVRPEYLDAPFFVVATWPFYFGVSGFAVIVSFTLRGAFPSGGRFSVASTSRIVTSSPSFGIAANTHSLKVAPFPVIPQEGK